MQESKKDIPISLALVISAIGVVYGDIGTSPLYALKSCFTMGRLVVDDTNVLGLTSLFVWALILIVSIKYVLIVMRVDDEGEGGILVLSSLFAKCLNEKYKSISIIFGLIGACLFFGDGVITPAISILSALEGLSFVSHVFSDHIVLLSSIVIFLLFSIQKHGSERIGNLFGPIMCIWFIALAVLGIYQLIQEPRILHAMNPIHAILFLYHNGINSFLALGGVILVVTGAEALYADMGHFGRKSIVMSWNYLVMPCLMLNYLGQGALLLHSPEAIINPFYLMGPEWTLYPMIALATMATIIASQALISGVFSVTWQMMMLGYVPRMEVSHTSHQQRGQVYMQTINYLLLLMTLCAVLIFQSSEKLAVAYGLSVAGVMMITTSMVVVVAYHGWKWPIYKIAMIFVPILIIDSVFLSTNLVKIVEGAWYTVMITLSAYYVIHTWRTGVETLKDSDTKQMVWLKKYISEHEELEEQKIPGTAIFMCRYPGVMPTALKIHLTHNKLLHEKVIFLSILAENIPFVRYKEKFDISKVGDSNFAISARYGFKEVPDLRKVLEWARLEGALEEDEKVSFFLSRSVPVASSAKAMSGFSERLFIYMARNSLAAYEFFKIPDDQIVELGVRYRI